MNSIRALARSTPQATSRLSASVTCRPFSAVRTTFLRTPKPTLLPLASRFSAAFSTSRTRWEKVGEVDDELVAKIDSELQMEKEMRDSDEVPVSVKDYLENGPFEIQDTPGQEEVALIRKFGDETIKVVFSIADLNTLENESDPYDDRGLYDEDDAGVEDGQSGGAQSTNAINAGRTRGGNIKVAPEDKVAPADRTEMENEEEADDAHDGDQEPSFPARVNVTIEKNGQGALQIETVAQDGMIVIDNVYYYPTADLADAKTAEKDWQRRGMYMGPPFGNLDEDLQVLLEKYLDERGVNTALALFVPDYIDYKEQREYMSWLSNVKNFIEK